MEESADISQIVKLRKIEKLALETLSLARSQSDVLREGLRLVWARDAEKALQALEILDPAQARGRKYQLQEYVDWAIDNTLFPDGESSDPWLEIVAPLVVTSTES